jgi:hypothetical protein
MWCWKVVLRSAASLLISAVTCFFAQAMPQLALGVLLRSSPAGVIVLQSYYRLVHRLVAQTWWGLSC